MSEANLTLIFDGFGVENGEIDVQDLAPALLSMGELIQAANHEINGNKAQIAVKVRATAEGSFEVDLTLIQSLVENTKALISFAEEHKEGIAAANELADLLFKVTGVVIGGITTVGGGLFALIKFLKGRKPDKIEKVGTEIHVHIGDNYFVANPRTIKLAESIPVREQAKKAISTLSRNGIDVIKVRRSAADDLEVSKGEVGYFDFEEVEEELVDETRPMTLQIISLSFKEDNKWRVTDGGDPFSATIEDVVFLNKIANDEVAFSKGDYLVCDVRERQFNTSKGLKKERSIIKVKTHKPAAQQLRLL
ncbi:MAG: hypothetical protein OXT65_09465 [Alphaproteobacteria bacterium]|nr:hypothetical protein [Alphaproteobacteria bacterium]